MKLIKAYLHQEQVTYEVVERYVCEIIKIPLENNCVLVNGYKEELHYDKAIEIFQDTYKNYIVVEIIGYARSKTHLKTRKQKEVIHFLEKRLQIKENAH